MKRSYIIALCALLTVLPASSAYAGAWSWHSDIIDQIIHILQDVKGSLKTQPVKPVTPAPKPLPASTQPR